MSYTPRVGSIAYRAIAWLEQQPVGAEFALSQLAEAVNGDGQTLLQILTPAIDGGSIVKRSLNGGGKPYRYSLSREQHPKFDPMVTPISGRATPVAEITPPPAPQQVLKAEAERPDATDRGTPASASPSRRSMGTGQAAAAAPAGQIRCALWSDGSLEILRTAEQREPITLTREETRALVAYLDAISLEGIAG